VTAPEQEGAFSAEVIFTTQFEVCFSFHFSSWLIRIYCIWLLMHVWCVA